MGRRNHDQTILYELNLKREGKERRDKDGEGGKGGGNNLKEYLYEDLKGFIPYFRKQVFERSSLQGRQET